MLDLLNLIADPGRWRREWRTHDPEALIAALRALPGHLPQIRAAFVLAHLGRLDEADALLAGRPGPLALATRAAVIANRAAATQEYDLLSQLTDFPELVPQGGDPRLAAEAQMMLDLIRGQAWRERGDWVKAGDLLRLALRGATQLGAPTGFIESQLASLTREPMERARILQGQLDAALRGGDHRETQIAASGLAEAALSCLDLVRLRRVLPHLPQPELSAYRQTLAYLEGHRALPVPDYPHPMIQVLRRFAALEQALLTEWCFDLPGAHAQARALLALPGIEDEHADAARHALAIVKARAWVILGEEDLARRELETGSRYKRLTLLAQAVRLEGCLLLGVGDAQAALEALAGEAAPIPPPLRQGTLVIASRIAPAATQYAADRLGDEWAAVARARVDTITTSLREAGLKSRRTDAEQGRVDRLIAFLQAHPELSLAQNAVLVQGSGRDSRDFSRGRDSPAARRAGR
ncbi:hypothetical protein [Deinococcus sp. S9]|uniref:hypothetical protein n=1 Tax=Deinococcus sp. S9 TaxID=2545754 RepID=UPI0014047666|nr:hypothetical protein [Deinococcus sp. S9]